MILVDSIGHMVSTENADELHKFAAGLGLKREWFQTPGVGKKSKKVCELGEEYSAHYDLTTKRMMNKAISMGAELVHPFELVKRAWWKETRKSRMQSL